MAKELFQKAPYERYPLVGKFTVDEPTGEKRSVTLWYKKQAGNEETPRFFEDDSPKGLLPTGATAMNRDNYNNLLYGLAVPVAQDPSLYQTEQGLYVARPGHRVIVERTVSTIPSGQEHTRIRRQALPPQGEIFSLPNYEALIDKLTAEEVIVAADFSHWTPQPPLGAKKELRTRINSPRK